MLLAWDFRLSLDLFDSGLHTCTAVASLTLAFAKLACTNYKHASVIGLHAARMVRAAHTT